MIFNDNLSLFSFLFIFLFLAGCSGGSSDNTGNSSAPAAEKNVAALANGSMVSSTFSGDESFTTDGDITTTSFWSGGANGDEIKVAFDKSYTVSEVTIYTNNTGFVVSGGGAVTTSGVRVQLSTDNIAYDEVAIALGLSAPITCSSSKIGSGKITCTLSTPATASFIKLIVSSDFAVTEIYEIEVLGV